MACPSAQLSDAARTTNRCVTGPTVSYVLLCSYSVLDEVTPLLEKRLALGGLVLPPVEFEQLNRVEQLLELRVRVGTEQKAYRIIERYLMAARDTSIEKAQTLGLYSDVTLGRKVP